MLHDSNEHDTRKQGTIWVRRAFLLPITMERPNSSGGINRRKRATSAAYKYTNTSLGGNFAINNPPQFTHYADIPHPGLGREEKQWQMGMGRYYSEAIDDPKQVVHLTFGVPEYSSWATFLANFYDSSTALLANTGRASSLFYNIGNIGGYVVSLPLQPLILGISAASKLFSFLSKSSPSKWYYFRPTMHSYWSAVNTIANELAINMGLVPRVLSIGMEDLSDSNDDIQEGWAFDRRKMHEMYPSIFRPVKRDEATGKETGGGIDVMVLARRTEMMSYYAQESMRKMAEGVNNLEGYMEKLRQHLEAIEPQKAEGMYEDSRAYFEAAISSLEEVVDGTEATAMQDLDHDANFSSWEQLSGVKGFLMASQRDGSQFVTFRVNHNGTMSESFQNSTTESQIAQQLNSKVSEGRSASFNFMGGQLIPGVGSVLNRIKDAVSGALDSVHLGGLATLTGTAFLDIPKLWEGSTANLPRAEYTIPLYSPYGNVLSRFINMMVPISMVLAGGLPLSAGRSSYTSPFICQIFHQGRVQCQLGMIDSITITRGNGNVGWNAENQMLGAEITFSVIDLSNILHIPIKGGFRSPSWTDNMVKSTLQAVAGSVGGEDAQLVATAITNPTVWDEHSLFSDYMSVLSSLSLSDIYYVGNRLNLNLTRAVTAFETWRSPSNFLSWTLDRQPARILSAFADFGDRLQ